MLADQARAEGDEAEAVQYEQTAQTLATQLVSAEQSMEDLKTLHDQALGAAAQARKAVENNAMILQQKLAERTKLLSQLEQAKMQETVARSLESMSSLPRPATPRRWTRCATRSSGGTPTRWAAPSWPATRSRAACWRSRSRPSTSAGSSRLEQIRASMAGEQLGGRPSSPAVPQAEQAAPAADPAAAARLDELRASMGRERGTGDTTAAG